MVNVLKMLEVDHLTEDELIVNFSDGTCARYIAADLAAIRPDRLPPDIKADGTV